MDRPAPQSKAERRGLSVPFQGPARTWCIKG